jgi:hypothetical protein
LKDDFFFFKTKDKFENNAFTKFTDVTRLDPATIAIFATEVSKFYDLSMYGMDILLDEAESNLYLIDINYFSSYTGIVHMNVEKEFKDLMRKRRALQ